MSEPPPNSQTKIAAESNSKEDKSNPSKDQTEESVSRFSADLSTPPIHTNSSPENKQEAKNISSYIDIIRNLSQMTPDPKDPQELSLKDYFPVYQNLFNTLQYLFRSFSTPPSESSSESVPLNEQNIHGKILVETPQGHDIQKFLQIYATASGIGFFLLDIAQLGKVLPDKQPEMLIQFFQDQSAEVPFILYIPFDQFLRSITHESYAIYHLIKALTKYTGKAQKNIILFSIHPNFIIPENLLDFFDLEFSLKPLDFSSRKQFLVTLLDNFTPKALDLDFDHLALQLEGWNFMDLRRFVKNATLLFLSEQHVHLKPKILETSYLTKLLEKGVIRMSSRNLSNSQASVSSNASSFQPIPQPENNFSTFDRRFSQQLYQDAASRDYEKLVIILDKLQKGIILQKFERELLGDYAFLLKTDPQQALQKLNKAKIRIEKIQRLIPAAKSQTN
ncbi:MAG: hypothetical protein ACTSWW_09100 [Promethearchaeota archaeon]